MRAFHYIRFSQKSQGKGNSTARQDGLAASWSARNGVPLDDTLLTKDLGISGFGKRERRAGLLTFLKACETGIVKRGDILLVENLDRLSREHPLDGMELIRTIIRQHGITIQTLSPEMQFTDKNLGQVEGILVYIELARGHGESARKSNLSRDNWNRKRDAAKTGKPVTAKVPSWCQVDGGKIVAIPEKAQIVNHIFDLSCRGFGYSVIRRKLKESNVQPIGKAKIWHESYVEKILKNRAVLGEYQPRLLEGGKLVPVGDVIPNYFPRIVKQEKFDTAQRSQASRRNQRGRITTKVSNLFTGIVFEQNQAMAVRTKCHVPYLQTADHLSSGILYRHFEKVMLYWLREVNLKLSNGDTYDLLKEQAEFQAKQIKTMTDMITTHPALADLLPKLAEMKVKQADTLKELDQASVPLQNHLIRGKELIAKLAGARADELEELRRELRQNIRMIVKRIDVTSKGKPKGAKRIDCYITFADGNVRELYYLTKAGRIVECGRNDLLRGNQRFYDNGKLKVRRTSKSDLDMMAEVQVDGGFPLEVSPKEARRQRCQELRKQGKTTVQIGSELGLHRVTVNELLRGR